MGSPWATDRQVCTNRWRARMRNLAAGALLLAAHAAMSLSCARSAPPAWAAQAAVPIVRNDYAAAREQAQQRGALLFVDVWAAWCQPCRQFQKQVLADVRLRRFVRTMVFSSIDSEDEDNADFLVRHPVKAWPTLLVLDPSTEEIVVALYGAPDATRFLQFLDRALQKHPARNLRSFSDAAR